MDDPDAPNSADGTPAGDESSAARSDDAQARRWAALQRELARWDAAHGGPPAGRPLDELVPYHPLTPEEVHDMFHGPKGPPLSEIIAELEAELGETL
jgi:hypothetical protein